MRTADRLDKIKQLAKRDGYVCQYPDCTEPFSESDPPTLDHWMPQMWCQEHGWSYERTWGLKNLKLMHRSCNAKKGHLIPNPDGSLPPRNVRERSIKTERPIHCNLCESGRLLLAGEECELCGSGPQPATAPKYLQVAIKDCDHDTTMCGYCFIGIIPRKSSLEHLITGP